MARNLKLAVCVLFSVFIECHSCLQQSLCDLCKQLFHVYTHFCTGLYKLYTQFISLLLSFIRAYLSFFRIVYFVANQNNGQIIASNLSCLVNPSLTICKRSFRSYIVAHNCHARVIDVTWYQGPESLLPSRVPKLESHRLVVNINSFS